MSRRRKFKAKIYEIEIESLSHEGRGISHIDNKVIFTRGALPGEKVVASRTLSRAKYEEADVVEVIDSSSDRIEPKCSVYGICGGCSFQHLSSHNQINAKNDWLQSAFLGQAKVQPKEWLEPIQVESWGYRRKARLGVRYVAKKEKVLVGFRERKSSFVTVMSRCEVLHPSLGDHLEALSECVQSLSIKEHVPQIEVAIAEQDTILILRHLQPLNDNDEKVLDQYAQKLSITWYLQSGGLETIKPLNDSALLTYSIPIVGITASMFGASLPRPLALVLWKSILWPLGGFFNVFIYSRPKVKKLRESSDGNKNKQGNQGSIEGDINSNKLSPSKSYDPSRCTIFCAFKNDNAKINILDKIIL